MSAPRIIWSSERMPPKKPFTGPLSRQAGQSAVPPAQAPDDSHGARSGVVRYCIEDLLRGGREATLIHRGEEYRLRVTSMGKLILTK